jgi:hypothetical protein
MLRLELYETTGKKKRTLGTLELVEGRSDPTTDTVAYAVMSGDRKPRVVAQIQTLAQLPWKAVLVALQTLYGHVAPHAEHLTADGQCNAVTKKGVRCQFLSMAGRYYCMTHDPARKGAA